MSATPRPAKRTPRGRPAPSAGAHHAGAHHAGSTRWTRWVAYSLVALYGLYWLVTAFSRHTIGNFAVETDFYWKYGPAARDLLRGVVSIENYDSKGWGYPLVVAAVSFLGFDIFRAGQIVALLSAVGAAWILYRLHRSLFGPVHALASLALVLANLVFIQNTYEVGTDMFFLAVSLASVALLLRSKSPSLRSLLASGLLGGFAFSTRYNGLFLLPGALLLFLAFQVPAGPMRDRARRAALWSAAFLLGALPWLVVNAIQTGNPLTNSNYVNVGYAVYGEGNWEKFFYGGRTMHSLADVVLNDPRRFAGTMVANFFDHIRRDLTDLLPIAAGVLAAAGAFLMWRDRPERRVVGYFAFGALSFLTLVPVFYGARFSLSILPFYAALAAWPVVSPTLGRPLGALERVFPLRTFLFLLLLIPLAAASYGRAVDPRWGESVSAGPHDLEPAIAFLRAAPRAEGDGLMARKPHAAFIPGFRFVPMPEFAGLDSLHAIATRERARYVLVSSAEVAFRPGIRPLAEATAPLPGFERVHESYGALVYEVVPMGGPAGTP
ncbi:MAG TPA: glycosyltransferase family 39 protein [Candidatus Eisenbacteria bacterium]|nr:glycosyltransferase family 39 protein [Candidatus Eisenbacteria bacterium]